MSSRARVLVVDDEIKIQQLFKLILGMEIPDVEIDVAGNGAEALEAFTNARHRVLLMDLHMPVMDGYQAFDSIMRRCSENGWEPPSVVFCTGFAPPETVRDVVQRDTAHCLLSKPVRNEVLVDAVRSRLS